MWCVLDDVTQGNVFSPESRGAGGLWDGLSQCLKYCIKCITCH